MYSVLKSYGLNGLNGFAVAVEADVSGGLPAFSLVGLPDSAVRESGDRVRAAVKNLGFKWPDRHITVNLAPADVRKTGPVLRTSAGARLTVMCRSGHLKPRFLTAARTRSPLSRTAESGRPTSEKAGSPPEMSASTATAKPVRPFRP